VPDAKRPDPRRRSPASRPGKPGDAKRDRPRAGSPVRREPRAIEARPAAEPSPDTAEAEPQTALETVRQSIVVTAEQQSDQRFGSAARRAAILAAVVCVLTLTIAGPVRTYFAQRTEMRQLAAAEAQLRAQIADLEQQKDKLADPAYIAAQARERLGFVMPGDIPYQVQLPPAAAAPGQPGAAAPTVPSGQPWYTSLWHTIADEPHGVSPTIAPGAPPGPPPAPGDTPAPPPPPGG
jgi:cell division protein FtsB